MTGRTLKSLTAFFPAYNEEQNIEAMVASLLKVLPDTADWFEVLVIDDGSRDRSGQIADALAEQNRCIRVVPSALLIAMTMSGHAAAVSANIVDYAIVVDW